MKMVYSYVGLVDCNGGITLVSEIRHESLRISIGLSDNVFPVSLNAFRCCDFYSGQIDSSSKCNVYHWN